MKKIMFNDKFGLTQAVLEGRKTMTRRIAYSKDILRRLDIGYDTKTHQCLICDGESIVARSQYHVGEVVAIAQAYKDIYEKRGFDMHDPFTFVEDSAGWTNKMFVKADLMPHHIKITNIRVENLQDISDEDCLREGVYEKKLEYTPSGYNPNRTYYTFDGVDYCFNDARDAFAELIDKVSGRGTWDSNPLVWVYEFELVD